MLGCVGSRSKGPLKPNSVVPSDIHLVARFADALHFEFVLTAATPLPFYPEEVTCLTEYLDEGTLSSAWTPFKDATWHSVDTEPCAQTMTATGSTCEANIPPFPVLQPGPLRLAGAAQQPGDSLGGTGQSSPTATPKELTRKMRCLAEVTGLKPERTYFVRVVAKGGDREELSFTDEVKLSTADRPKVASSTLTFLGRTADSLEVRVKLEDPDGAPVTACEVQFKPDVLVSGWDAGLLDVEQGAIVKLSDGTTTSRYWRGVLRKLQGNTQYRLRARAQNAVGWSWDCTPEIVQCTSDRPEAPDKVVVVRRHGTAATLGFALKDPDGAPITSFSVHVHGAFGYSKNDQAAHKLRCAQPVLGPDGYYPAATRKALGIVEGLQPDTEYCLRLGSNNAAGASRQLSQPVQFKTSAYPPVVGQAAVQVGPKSLAFTWEMQDPVGAPIEQLQLEYSKDAMFGSWESVDATPVALKRGGEMCFDQNQLAAAVLVAKLTGSSSVLRHWHVEVNGLAQETGYLLRARARSSAGWSPSYSVTFNVRTSDRPPMPTGVSCRSRHPNGVWLECSVDEVLGTAPVSGIAVEEGGSFSWSEVAGVEAERLASTSATASRWRVFVPLGVTPGILHEVRLWALNVYGRSSKPSGPCPCRTSDKPPVPASLACLQRHPHSLLFDWKVQDPEGAPVWKFEVQYRSDQAFSSWQTSPCPDLERRSNDTEQEDNPFLFGLKTKSSVLLAKPLQQDDLLDRWACLLEDLEAATGYRLVIRACNEVGWSEWSPEVWFETSSLPQLGGPRPDVFRVRRQPADSPGHSDDTQESEFVSESAMVDLELEDPAGAPILACMIRCKDGGIWTLATRRSVASSPVSGRIVPLSRWTANLPIPRTWHRCTVSIKAANAVGWSAVKDHRGILIRRTVDELEAVETLAFGTCTTLELVSSEVRNMLVMQQEAQQRVVTSLTQASSRKDDALITTLSLHGNRLGQRIQLLQEVTQHLDPDKSSLGGENYGADLTAQLQEALQRQKLVPDGQKAASLLALLLRGYVWLENWWKAEIAAMTDDIAKAKGVIPESGGNVLMQWISQSQTWTDTFQAKVGEALPEGLGRACQLLATLAAGRKLAQLESVRADLDACLTLVAAATRQLRKLRHSHRILCAAEAAISHDFERRSALKKIETTALGLVTMLVLPVPGSMEIGTINIGMVWLAGDSSNSHVAVEHPTGTALAPMLERLGSSPPRRAAVILRGWDSGGHQGLVLVHNATARRISATVLPGETETFSSAAAHKFAEAHPYIRGAQMAMSQQEGGDSIAVIPPTDVALIHVPHDQGCVRLEFSYGTVSHAEKAIGKATIRSGSAVSFMCLDAGVQVCNSDGDALVVQDGTIRVVNNDLAPITVAVYRPAEVRKHFEGALSTTTMRPGEVTSLPLPQPNTGCIYELEVKSESGKLYSEVRPGQCLVVDSAG